MGKEAHPPSQKWDGIVRRQVDITVRAVNEEERSIQVVASTDTIDAHGDIVEQDFDLKRFKKNPVVLWLHNAFGFFDGARAEDFLPIGRATDVTFERGQLEAKLIFVEGDGEDSLAEKVWRRVKQQILRAVSIGFRPGEVTEETVEGKTRFRLRKNELFEISVVPIPSNPDAVAKAVATERENFSRLAAKTTEDPVMAMTDDEKKSLDQAKADLAVAQDKLKSETERAENANKQLTAEKAISAKLTTELETERKALAEANAKLAKGELDARQGKKFAPSEREELESLMKDVGADRVCKLLDARPDLTITERVKGPDGDDLTRQLPPTEIDGDPSAEIANQASKALTN